MTNPSGEPPRPEPQRPKPLPSKPPLSKPLRRAERVVHVVLVAAGLAFATTLTLFLTLRDRHQPLDGWWPVGVTGALFLIAVVATVVRPFTLERRRMILSAALATLVLVTGTVLTWTMVSKDDAHVLSPGTVVENQAGVQSVLDRAQDTEGRQNIATGLFLQQVSFDGPTGVNASGYIWQRLPKGFDGDFAGVVLPDAEDSYGLSEVYRDDHVDGTTTVGWYFKARLAQSFDYTRYPFDRQSVRLRLWSTDRADDSVTLVPDFRSYPPWENGRRLGADPHLVLQGWDPTFTSWSYQQNHYATTLGGNTRPYAQAPPVPPDLYFNYGIAREWQAPLLSSLTRWTIVAVMIFLALFVYSKEEGQIRPNLGFSTWAVITFSVSMLLVIVVDQSSVREQTGTAMAYVEWFALALYVVILLVALNAVLLTSRTSTPRLEWHDNQLAKLLYWPVLTGIVFAATLFVFRPRW